MMLNLSCLVGVVLLGGLRWGGDEREKSIQNELAPIEKSAVTDMALSEATEGSVLHLATDKSDALCFTRVIGRQDSRPYVSGDTFRTACQHAYDNLSRIFYPTKVKRGDLVFVKSDYLADFFAKYHAAIPHPYILVTHNSDDSSPGRFAKYLADAKLAHWFGTNCDLEHPKFTPIHVGLANRYCKHGNITNMIMLQQKLRTLSKKQLLCMNFVLRTNPVERQLVYNLFKAQPYCKTFIDQHEVGVKNFMNYLTDLAESNFVLCPHGHGMDCHRTWEALLVGSYPIVRSSSLDPLYTDLPVVIVNDWAEIDEQFLLAQQAKFKAGEYTMEKLYFKYWERLLKAQQARVRGVV